jgi:hypothetical protein
MATVPSATFTHTAEEIDAAVDAVADKASQEDLDALAAEVDTKQDALTFDSTPTANSDNPVKSKGIKSYVDTGLSGKQDALTFDSTPTANSDNPVKSKGIKTYVDTQVATKASISDVYGIGTAIESGTDLNNLTTAGVYTCPTVTVANTLTNAPITGSAFRLEVKYLNNSTRLRQECYILSDTSTYYARTYTSTGWKPWYMFTGTPVS